MAKRACKWPILLIFTLTPYLKFAISITAQVVVLTVNCVTACQILAFGVATLNCNTALSADPGSHLSNLQIQAIGNWSDSQTGTLNFFNFVWATTNGSNLNRSTPN